MAKFSVQLQICPAYEQATYIQNVSFVHFGRIQLSTRHHANRTAPIGQDNALMVINDMMKLDLNRGNNMQQLFFYRDKSQREVDVLRILPPNLVEAYEIKSAQTWNADFFANMNYLRPLLKERLLKTTVVYDGQQENPQAENGIINFRHLRW